MADEESVKKIEPISEEAQKEIEEYIEYFGELDEESLKFLEITKD